MTDILFNPIRTETVHALQAGGLDAYRQKPQYRISDGDGVPCRHCLRMVGAGEPYLLVAHRPFTALQPFAETGPIFLHAEPCEPGGGAALPRMLESPDYIVRGYDSGERIVYGTGGVVPREAISARAGELLGRDDIAFVHVRSARNNCYQVRVDRV